MGVAAVLGRTSGFARSLFLYHAIPRRSGRLDRFHGRFIRSGDLVFDIGAHIGNRTRSFSRLRARVIAVEPQPDFARFLRLIAGFDRRITVVETAVGAAPGQLDLHISSRHPTVTTASADWIDEVSRDASFAMVSWDRTVTVPCTTLDALIADHGVPAFCKIDVEGFEPDVLSGLSHTVPAVAVEYIPSAIDRAVACVERLSSLGDYRFNAVAGESYRMALPHPVSAEVMTDWLHHMREERGSGDIYASLDDSGSAA